MYTVNTAQARRAFSEMIDMAKSEAVMIKRGGEMVAVMLSPERCEQLLGAREELEDVAGFDEAMAEEVPSVPWGQVEEDLGWV